MATNKKANSTEQISKPMLITIIVFAVISALLLGAAVTMAIIEEINKNYDNLDYLNDDLSQYIEFDESAYKDYDIEINVPNVSDTEVEHEILKTLASKKGSLLYDGKYVFTRPVAAGDKVYIYYRGYELDEDGNQIELEGTSNFSETKPKEYTIGGGQLIVGFELALVGVIPDDHKIFTKITDGRVEAGDIVYCTMTYIEETTGGVNQNTQVRIDLNDPKLEEKWGEGILDYLREEIIGVGNYTAISLPKKGTGDYITYTAAKVDFVTRGTEVNPLVIKTVFPYNYKTPELRNKTVYFEVYINGAVCYESATLDDTFITDTLKLTAEYLAEYEGDTLTEKYRSYVKADLQRSREDDIRVAAEDAVWKYLKEHISVKKYPERELRRIFDDYYYSHYLEFSQNYSTYYEDLDSYLNEYYGLGENGDWRAYLEDQVKEEVTEKLIFYSILAKENLVPDEEKFKEIYQKELEYDFAYYGKTRKDFDTEEAYLEALAKYEKTVLDYYGKDFYTETVYYNYAIDLMIEMANVVNKGVQ